MIIFCAFFPQLTTTSPVHFPEALSISWRTCDFAAWVRLLACMCVCVRCRRARIIWKQNLCIHSALPHSFLETKRGKPKSQIDTRILSPFLRTVRARRWVMFRQRTSDRCTSYSSFSPELKYFLKRKMPNSSKTTREANMKVLK
jgi:hypothetical protein